MTIDLFGPGDDDRDGDEDDERAPAPRSRRRGDDDDDDEHAPSRGSAPSRASGASSAGGASWGGSTPRGSTSRPPLAERMRPRALDEVVGQRRLTAPDGPLRRSLARGVVPSLVLWGPPGCGKTTIARLIAAEAGKPFAPFSAVTGGVKEVRAIVAEARHRLRIDGQSTVLFVDEIHRFNRAQQDAFLPHVEQGTIVLLGATTENPSLALNAALLSRAQVEVLAPLGQDELVTLLRRALADVERGLARPGAALAATDEALERIAAIGQGDARTALAVLEAAALLAQTRGPAMSPRAGVAAGASQGASESARASTSTSTEADAASQGAGASQRTSESERASTSTSTSTSTVADAAVIDRDCVDETVRGTTLRHDRAGDAHYDLASALIKSLRGSDPDAGLYWLARLLQGGEDPRFVARRLMIFAAEDVSNADPRGLGLATATAQAVALVGMPEARIILAQAVTFLALCPKSNASYLGIGRAIDAVETHGPLPVPLHLRNAPTGLLASLGHGRGYEYAHDLPGGVGSQVHLPAGLESARFYEPTDRGQEKELAARLERLRQLRASRRP